MTHSRINMAKPDWALSKLRQMGYEPDTSMDSYQQTWWDWYTRQSEYYSQSFKLNNSAVPCERLSLSPAAMVAGEIPSLVMTEGTTISSDDDALNDWIEATMPNFVDRQSDLLSNVFALGAGAWAADYSGMPGQEKTSIRAVNAWATIPLAQGGCAFVSRVAVDNKRYDQLQIRCMSRETSTEHIYTYLFDTELHGQAIELEDITQDLDTKQTLPTWALIVPSKANVHNEYTTLGVSIVEDALDACRLVDEAFNQLYWQVRLSLPRVIADTTGLKQDPKTGKVEVTDTLNQILYAPIEAATATTPVTIYNPDTHVADMVDALNNALGLLGQRTGFGVGYWSFNLNSGLKTATEVVAANSVLMRTIRRHEHSIENSLRRLIQGAYSAECALHGHMLAELPGVTVIWDDSVISDDKADRDQMKDDISRGLCPKWRYLTTYYSMSEEDARAFTGELSDVSITPMVGE